MEWQPIETAPKEDGWYLVTWQSPTGKRFVDYSEFVVGPGFSDRWGCNADPVAWTWALTPKLREDAQ